MTLSAPRVGVNRPLQRLQESKSPSARRVGPTNPTDCCSHLRRVLLLQVP